jgi:hypothetical protein
MSFPQLPKRTFVVLFLTGLVFGLSLILLGQGFSVYQANRLRPASSRYKDVYRQAVVVDTSVTESRERYVSGGVTVVVQYPKTLYADVNEDIKKLVEEQIALFESDFGAFGGTEDDQKIFFVGYASSAIPGYSLSFLFDLAGNNPDLRGEDHAIVSRSYDLANGRVLLLEDVFTSVPLALKEVSQLIVRDKSARRELPLEELRIYRDGATPSGAYRNFILGPDSITFYFVSPGTGTGMPELLSAEIFYTRIRSLLSQEFLDRTRLL